MKNLINLDFKKKIFVALIIAGLMPLVISGMMIFNQTSDAMHQAAISNLQAQNQAKKLHIEEYFASIDKQVKTFSNSVMIKDAMNEFNYAFSRDVEKFSAANRENYLSKVKNYYLNDFSNEYEARNQTSFNANSIIPTSNEAVYFQHHYIANSAYPLGEKGKLLRADAEGIYHDIHERYHPIIEQYQSEFGYYDIFLVEPENGYIVYSVFKELDYATSLVDGPYRDSGIAKAFNAVRDSKNNNFTHIEDFASYLPSYDAPASFVASPIIDNNLLVGVLIFQMPVDNITNIMSEVAGLGASGESYLLGSDSFMRSQSSKIAENTILATKIDTPASLAISNGEEGSSSFINHHQNQVIAAYSPLNINGLSWGIVSEINSEEAHAVVKEISANILYIGIGISVAVLVLAFFVQCTVMKQLGGDPNALLQIADEIIEGKLERNPKYADKKLKGLLRRMLVMQDTLKDNYDKNLKKNRRIERIKQALDSVSSSIMVADADLNIFYVNQTGQDFFNEAEDEIKKELPHFDAESLVGTNIDSFHKDPSHQRHVLGNLTSNITTDIKFGEYVMRISANPITVDQERIGTVVEWRDITAERQIESEVQHLVDSSLAGDLSKRISLENKEGYHHRLCQSINNLVGTFESITGDIVRVLDAVSHGDLDKSIEKEYQGTYGALKNDLNNTVNKLKEIVTGIKQSSVLVNQGADEISRGNLNLSGRTESQAASLESTTSSIEEITSSVKNTANNAISATEVANVTSEEAEKSGHVVQQAVDAMSDISKSSNQISEIIGVIDEIAFQTNLLALNASVEAARAGEQGRGFAVVASEVRNLAGRSATAAKEIKELIQDSSQKVEIGTQLVNKSGETLENIISRVQEVATLINDINNASNEQAIGIEQVNSQIVSIDGITQSNAALVEQAAAAAESMKSQSSELENMVDFFKFDINGDEEDLLMNLPIASNQV